ncbi:MAG: sigma-70 family RNA polymerase sigma factor [Ornithinimicrobium sp.]
MEHVTPEHDADMLWLDYLDNRELDTRNHLVVHYTPLVTHLAGRMAARLPSSVDKADLISEGNIGLMKVIDKYDPARGIRFETYAVQRIRGAMIDSLRAADWAPRSVRDRQRDTDQVARTQVPVGHLFELDEFPQRDDILSNGQDLTDEDRRALLTALVCDLPERDAVVITLYYFEGLSLAEVGEVLSVTESRVSQLHARATRTLRAALNAQANA